MVDEADLGPGNGYVKLSGLVWSAEKEDIKRFLSDCSVEMVEILKNERGLPSGRKSSTYNKIDNGLSNFMTSGKFLSPFRKAVVTK